MMRKTWRPTSPAGVRGWLAGWEQWLARPFGWLSAVSMNWLDETPRAYNLPCAFSDFVPVCPAAPQRNRLPFAVEAGEHE